MVQMDSINLSLHEGYPYNIAIAWTMRWMRQIRRLRRLSLLRYTAQQNFVDDAETMD
jgi:hypothetical protein